MKFQVPREVLAEAVQWTARAVPQRAATPILAAVKMRVDTDSLTMSSYDYETSAQAVVPVETDEPGEVLVSGRLLAQIAGAIPKQPVTIEQRDTYVELTCGSTHFTLPTMPVDDYPQLPTMPELRGTLDAKEFADAIAQVAIAASSDETLAVLTAMKVEIEGNCIRLMATDRYRLACKEFEWTPTDPNFQVEFLVKSRIVADIAKSMTSSGDLKLLFSTDDSQEATLLGFECEGRQATSALMTGDYPPVMKLFPEETPIEMQCNRQELLDAVNRMALVTPRKTSIRLGFQSDALRLEAGQGNNAQAEETIALSGSSDEFMTAFNPDYLRAGLSALKTEYVNFGFTHPTKAVVITGKEKADGEADESFRYLLMPIRFGA